MGMGRGHLPSSFFVGGRRGRGYNERALCSVYLEKEPLWTVQSC